MPMAMNVRSAICEEITGDDRLPARPHHLHELARLTAPELLALYRTACAPTVAELTGDLRGRMLAVRGTGPLWSTLLRACAASRYFPWRGKSFAPRSSGLRGDGIKDELRRVGPGLYLGQAYLVLWGKPRLGLYFALQSAC